MRQVVNNLQSTVSGFSFVSPENVFKVCDQPHPVLCQEIIQSCMNSDIDKAIEKLMKIWTQGFSAIDIVSTLFKVTKTFEMPEYLKLDFIRVFHVFHRVIIVIGNRSDPYESSRRADFNSSTVWIGCKTIENEYEPQIV